MSEYQIIDFGVETFDDFGRHECDPDVQEKLLSLVDYLINHDVTDMAHMPACQGTARINNALTGASTDVFEDYQYCNVIFGAYTNAPRRDKSGVFTIPGFSEDFIFKIRAEYTWTTNAEMRKVPTLISAMYWIEPRQGNVPLPQLDFLPYIQTVAEERDTNLNASLFKMIAGDSKSCRTIPLDVPFRSGAIPASIELSVEFSKTGEFYIALNNGSVVGFSDTAQTVYLTTEADCRALTQFWNNARIECVQTCIFALTIKCSYNVPQHTIEAFPPFPLQHASMLPVVAKDGQMHWLNKGALSRPPEFDPSSFEDFTEFNIGGASWEDKQRRVDVTETGYYQVCARHIVGDEGMSSVQISWDAGEWGDITMCGFRAESQLALASPWICFPAGARIVVMTSNGNDSGVECYVYKMKVKQ